MVTQVGKDRQEGTEGVRPAVRPGAFAPFKYPVFRAIWIANLTSNLGAMVQSVAAAWLMTELTDSNQLIALIQASTTLPIMLWPGMKIGQLAFFQLSSPSENPYGSPVYGSHYQGQRGPTAA